MTDQPYLSYLYLYAAHTKRKIGDLVKNKCIDEEFARIKEIFRSWEEATESLRQIETEDTAAVQSCETSEISSGLVDAIKLNPSITNTFSKYVYDFKMVEIDNMIAVQRQVLLDFVDELSKKISKNLSEDELLKFCLIPEKQVPLPKLSPMSSNSWYYSSPSADFRFLGGFAKNEITREDIQLTKVSGFPTNAIILFVGYGAGCMHAYSVNGRMVLMNGFHRAYALRRKGIKKIPLLVRKIGNADLEFPSEIQDLKKDYLLKHPRPILLKDFFNEDLVRVFKKKKVTTILKVNWDSETLSIDL
ncbi:MAG: hypothetical protein ACE5EJ_03545 [Nitrosopumilaceae archaeon]